MEKYLLDDFCKEIIEKLSTEVVSYIMEQIKTTTKADIKERAKETAILSLCRSDYPYDKRSVEFGYISGAKEQKAIDEEVRLKKCDDMTEAEYNRETAFVDWYLKNGKGTPTYSDAIEWAREEVINKACEWLDNYLMEIGYPDDWMRDSPNMESGEERFIKAMEE